MNSFFSFVTLISLCVVVVDNHPLNEEKITKHYIESVIDYWRKTRAHDPCAKTAQSAPIADLKCNLDQAMVDEIHSYQDVVNEIIELFLTGEMKGKTFDLLGELTDTFGPRLAGSQALEDSIDWIVSRSTKEGFNSYTEDVTVPQWVRNDESLIMMSPRVYEMTFLGLGTSIGTPPEGITAEVFVASSFEELEASAASVSGKIVVYDVPFTTYGDTVVYRSEGSIRAAKVGAVASLVRSVTDFSLSTPHTGWQNYDPDVKKIPSAAITVEDATMLHRMQDRGDKIILNLTMGAMNYPDTLSRNTILDVEGSETPDEVVVVSGHLDSWDVGTAAMDDAGACVISWMAGKAIKALNLTPRRTFRTIMFTAEEPGAYGGEAYFRAHGASKSNYQLMMESDHGTFYPRGIAFSGTNESTCIMQNILYLTELIGTTELITPSSTSDLGGFEVAGVPSASLNSENENYFWYHHSPADRMEVYDSDTLDRVAALWTAVAYVTADTSFRLPQENSLKFRTTL